jgi:hypothetical protein
VVPAPSDERQAALARILAADPVEMGTPEQLRDELDEAHDRWA